MLRHAPALDVLSIPLLAEEGYPARRGQEEILSLHLQLSSVKLQPTSGDFSAANGIIETSRESPTVNISSRDDSYTVRCWMGSLNGALHRILIVVSQEK